MDPDNAIRSVLTALGVAALLVLSLGVTPAFAQRVHGRVQGIVLDGFSHGPVTTADVRLVGSKGKVFGRAHTGRDGRFAIAIPRFGPYRLEVAGPGYARFATDVFWADTSQQVSAEVDLVPAPIVLEGLDVTTTALDPELRRVGYYKREAKGVGYFLNAEQVHARVVDRITDVFYGLPGFQVRQVDNDLGWDVTARAGGSTFLPNPSNPKRGYCVPSVSVDGTIIRHGGRHVDGEWYMLVDPENVAAMEIYPTAAGAPPWLQGNESPCGAILIWTKTGSEGRAPGGDGSTGRRPSAR